MKNLIIIKALALLYIGCIESMEEYQKPVHRPSRPARSVSAIERMSKGKNLDMPVKSFSDSWGKVGIRSSINTSKKEEEINALLIRAMSKDMTKEADLNGLLAWVIVLLHNGANPNMMFMGESLLHKALIMKAEPLIKALLKYNVDYSDEHFLTGPIFFDAPTTEIAQLFINKGIDVRQVNRNGQTVLWHILDCKFHSSLVYFYLEHNVDVNHINEFDGTNILHSFAAYKEVKDEDNFLAKARLLFQKNPALVNSMNHDKKTPVIIAEETIQYWGGTYPLCVSPLQKLINLFKEVV